MSRPAQRSARQRAAKSKIAKNVPSRELFLGSKVIDELRILLRLAAPKERGPEHLPSQSVPYEEEDQREAA